MSRRFLQALGLLSLLALAGVSLAALLAVREKLHITIEETDPSAARGPDPVALLAEDLAALQADVSSLGDALGEGLRAVHDGLEQASSQRDEGLRAELRLLHRELAELHSEAVQAEQRALELRAGLGRLEPSSGQASGGASVPEMDAASGVQSSLAAQVEQVTPAASIAEANPPTPVELKPEGEPKPKSFLSFQLPSQAFAFDRAQRFEVVASLSRVGFDAKSTLHDFTGATQAVKGELQTCLARPAELCRGTIAVEARALDTGEPARDQAMLEHLAAAAHPLIRFEWTAFEPEAVDATAMAVRGVARGRMSVRGVERDFSMPVRVTVDRSRRVAIDGESELDLAQFGVSVPSKLGVISMEREVKVWIALRLRAVGPATAEAHGAQ